MDCEKYSLKPDIRIGNYYLQWNTDGLGVNVHEVNQLKNFIRKTIPALEQYMIFLQNEKKNNSNTRDPYADKKNICIKEKYNKRISFLMFIDSQGSTLYYREESCDAGVAVAVAVANKSFKPESGDDVYSENSTDRNYDSSSNSYSPSSYGDDDNNNRVKVELKWLLGELLFDRKPQNQKKKIR